MNSVTSISPDIVCKLKFINMFGVVVSFQNMENIFIFFIN